MLYATEGIKNDEDFNKAMVGVASVWWVNQTNFQFDQIKSARFNARYEGNP